MKTTELAQLLAKMGIIENEATSTLLTNSALMHLSTIDQNITPALIAKHNLSQGQDPLLLSKALFQRFSSFQGFLSRAADGIIAVNGSCVNSETPVFAEFRHKAGKLLETLNPYLAELHSIIKNFEGKIKTGSIDVTTIENFKLALNRVLIEVNNLVSAHTEAMADSLAGASRSGSLSPSDSAQLRSLEAEFTKQRKNAQNLYTPLAPTPGSSYRFSAVNQDDIRFVRGHISAMRRAASPAAQPESEALGYTFNVFLKNLYHLFNASKPGKNATGHGSVFTRANRRAAEQQSWGTFICNLFSGPSRSGPQRMKAARSEAARSSTPWYQGLFTTSTAASSATPVRKPGSR